MKIAINGIGVAGPTLAYWLRRAGHEPVLFEQAPAPRRGGYLIDFWGLGYEIAELMGLIPTLRERSYEIQRMRLVDGNGREQAALDLTPSRERLQGRFISIARDDLASALYAACQGVPAHFGVSIASVAEDDTGVVATRSDGSRERFDLVIGADGLHSRVRELAFGSSAQFESFLDCYVAAFRLSDYPRRDELTYVSHTVPKRQVARVTLRQNETLILLVCRADAIGGSVPPRHEQKLALRRAFADVRWEVPEILDRMDSVADLYFDRVSQIHLPHWSVGRIGLLGDAAACPSLLAGEGTGLAMLEAYVLAGEIQRAGDDFVRAFEQYERRLRSFVAAKQRSALRLRGFFAPETALALRLRNIAFQALSLPVLGKRLVERSLQDDFELPRYLAA